MEMHRLLKWAVLVFIIGSAQAQAQTETFTNYVNGLPVATPLATSDQFYVLQNGASKKTPFSALAPTPTGVSTTLGASLTNDQQPNGIAPVWNRLGVAIDPTVANCGLQNSAQERSVLYDTSPKILTGAANVFKMWYHAGIGTSEIDYAESTDGVNWTCYAGNPVIGPGWTEVRSVIKNGSTYITYLVNLSTGNIDRFTSLDGIGWSLTNAGVIVPGAGPAWDNALFNPFVWMESPTAWKMIYSGANQGGSVFPCGLATSTDGITWVKSGSNPVINDNHQACSAYVYKAGNGTYTLWTQWREGGNDNVLNDIVTYTSTNLTSWTIQGLNCNLCRGSPDEGFGLPAGNPQIADPNLVEANGNVLMTYTSTPNQSKFRIKSVIAHMTLAQLVTTSGGDNAVPFIPAGYGNPLTLGLGANGERMNVQAEGTFGFLWGINAYFDLNTDLAQNASGHTGFYENFIDTADSNATTFIRRNFVNKAGTGVFLESNGMTGGGLADIKYIASSLCVNSLAPGNCGIELTQDGGTGGSLGLLLGTGSHTINAYIGVKYTEMPATTAPSGFGNFAFEWMDSTAVRPMFNYNNGPNLTKIGGVASGTSALGTGGIASGTCAAAVTTMATNAVTTDTISWSFNAAPSTGWPSLTVQAYATQNNVNFVVCNPSAATATPAAETLNWIVLR